MKLNCLVILSVITLFNNSCQYGRIDAEHSLGNIHGSENQAIGGDSNSALDINGLYLGESDNEGSRRAWFIRLNANDGFLYMPPNRLKIDELQVDSDGLVSFHSEVGLGGMIYSFKGHVVSNANLQGEITITDRNGAGTIINKLLLKKLDDNEFNKSRVNGFYTNMEYVEESGDLIGNDLILIPYEDKLFGIFTSYENEMTPYIANIVNVKNRISFRIQTENGEQNFRGTLSHKKVTIIRAGKEVAPDMKEIILERRNSLKNMLKE